jgi:drug/metabolite transporter (DMT)-like permease
VTTDFAAGLLAALGAAVLYGGAPVFQAIAVRRAPAGHGAGVGLMASVLRRPIWLLGLLGEAGGFLLEAFAFSAAPATLVAPVTACDVMVFVLLGSVVLRARLTSTGRLGTVATAGGVALLAVALGSGSELGRPAATSELLWCAVACAGAVVLVVAAGQRAVDGKRPVQAAIAFSIGAGCTYGVATLSTRQIGRTFQAAHPWSLLSTPTPYVLVGCGVLGIALLQRGLQTGPLLTFPIVSALSAFVPVVVGVVYLNDAVPTGGRRAVFVAALVLVIAGIVLLGRDRSAAERATPSSAPPPAEPAA